MEGKFIVFEGLDCAGKTTQAKMLAEWLPASGLLPEGRKVILTREPGGTDFGNRIRPALLEPLEGAELCQRAELLLFAADRAQHVEEVIAPALERGDWVVCDRFTGSTIAYQGYGHDLPYYSVEQICEFALTEIEPDLTILLDLGVEECVRRLRLKPDSFIKRHTREDRNFLQRVNEGFLRQYCQNDRWMKVNSGVDWPISIVADTCKYIVNSRFERYSFLWPE